MKQDAKQFVFLSQAGCLLPGLLFFNFIFGWIFFKPLHWILIGLVLFLLFILNLVFTARKVMSVVNAKENSVIDIEGQVVDDDERHPRLGNGGRDEGV